MLRDDAVGDFLTREDYHGHARAGIGGGSAEEESLVFGTHLGCFEAAVRFPIGDDSVDRSLVGAIHALDVIGKEDVFGDDVFAEILEAGAFHLFENAMVEGEVIFARERFAVLKGRNVGEDLDIVTTRRCLAGISAGGCNDVDGGVVRELLVIEDRAEVFVLVLTVKEIVMSQLRVGNFGPNMRDDPGAGGRELLEFLHEARSFAEEFFIAGNDFHIADHEVGFDLTAILEAKSGDGFSASGDFADIGIEMNSDAHFRHQFSKAFGQGIHPSTDIPESVVELDDRHHIHVAGRVERGRADILDEVFKDGAEFRVAQSLRNRFRHAGAIVQVSPELERVLLAKEIPKGVGAILKIGCGDDVGLRAGVF